MSHGRTSVVWVRAAGVREDTAAHSIIAATNHGTDPAITVSVLAASTPCYLPKRNVPKVMNCIIANNRTSLSTENVHDIDVINTCNIAAV